MKLVLDTNIYSDYAEGLADVVEAIVQYGQDLFIPSIVLGELTYGFLKGNRQVYNERKLHQIINRLKIGIIPVDADVARKYGFIFLALQKKGTKIPINDVWIAACCMTVGGILLTRDRHFEQVDQIETMILTS
ncbi:MAG: type II toxin-antitoxin system VapC family toxin [Deltaproteobacteria bacterium]|nr:type II toxin-antitoxin system VapC family toxin [Deltaproteobacteria bacterium]